MLIKNPFRASPWLLLLAGLLAGGCEEKTPDNINTPAHHAKRSRELEQRLAQTKPDDLKSRGTGAADFNSLRAEREMKLKEAKLRLEKQQIAKVSFTSEQPPEGVSVEGLSSPEPWGSWSVGNKVTLRFDKPLPTQFKLQVTARAYGPNAEKPITLLLGKQKESMAFRSFNSMQTRNIKLKTPVDTLTFVVPEPTSPAELKESTDDRKLGIGLVQVVLLRTTP